MLLPKWLKKSIVYKTIKIYILRTIFPLQMRIKFFRFASRVKDAGTVIKDEKFELRNFYYVKKKIENNPKQKFIISADIHNIYSGLGCNLHMLGPAWKYAIKTNRTLIIDWRGNPYTRNEPVKNLFPLLFETPSQSEIGISVIADDSINNLRLPQPILGPSNSITQPFGENHNLPSGGLNILDLRRIIHGCYNISYPTILPSLESAWIPLDKPFLNPIEGKKLYGSLKLKPQWAEKVNAFYYTNLADMPVIGIHIRHGNGEEKYRDHFKPRIINDFDLFMQAITEKIKRYADKRFGNDYKVFLCTDSDVVVTKLTGYFPTLVSRQIWRPSQGKGVDFDHAYKLPNGGIGAAGDALVDMQLLAKCDAILMSRNTAFASHIPYILEKPGAEFYNYLQTARL